MPEGFTNFDAFSDTDWERIARHVAGESTSDDSAAMDAWLAADSRRGELVRALQQSLTLAGRESSPGVDVEAALRKVKSRMQSPELVPLARAAPRSSLWSSPVLRLAAAIAIVAGGALLLRDRAVPSAAPRHFATSVGERREIRLSDGSNITLAPNSELEVSASYGAAARAVALTGEAFFDVKHDSAHPFAVAVDGVSIRDVGTSFVVSQDGPRVDVVVATGSVAVSRNSSPHDETVVVAGSHVSLSPEGAPSVDHAAQVEERLAWTQGRLVFRDASLRAVSAEIYRWYGVRLQTADSTISARHITASFSGEPVDQVLHVIALTLGASVERQGDLAILRTTVAPSVSR